MPRLIPNIEWLAGCLLVGALLLLGLVVSDLGGSVPDLPSLEGAADSSSSARALPAAQSVSPLFDPEPAIARELTSTNNPFYTAHFDPPPPPPPKEEAPPKAEPPPAPKPPPPRNAELRFQGFFLGNDGEPKAFLKINDRLEVSPAGTPVTNEWVIAEIRPRSLVMTNSNGETNVLEFNRTKSIELPPE